MAKQTKNELIEALDNVTDRLAKAQLELEEARRQLSQVSDLKANVAKLKEVARFYRAQRDRVDGYLSGVLDMVELLGGSAGLNPHDTTSSLTRDLRQVVMQAEGVMDRSQNRGRRPAVREPYAQPERDDAGGRYYAGYRDKEPQGWEDL